MGLSVEGDRSAMELPRSSANWIRADDECGIEGRSVARLFHSPAACSGFLQDPLEDPHGPQ
jgi:hypothetical protein